MNPEERGGDENGNEAAEGAENGNEAENVNGKEDGRESGPVGPAGEAGESAANDVGRDVLDPEKIKAVLEAILHVSGQPLSLDRLTSVVGNCSRKEVRALLDELNTEYLERGRAFEIVEVANGLQVRTRPEFAPWLAKLQPQKPVRLSRAALETLAIVAYKQPATRAEVESIRGVDTGAAIGSLLEKRLVRVLGRKEIAGRPILYGTSQDFLDFFGLKNLASLPTLKEIEGMFAKQEEAEAADELGAGEAGEGEGGPESGVAKTPDEAAGAGAGERVPGGGDAAEADSARGAVKGVSGTGERGAESGSGAEPGVRPPGGPDREDGWVGGASREEEESWDEEEGDLETAELDALLRAAKTRVLSYEEVAEREGGVDGEMDEWEESSEGDGDGKTETGAGAEKRRGGARSDGQE